MEPGYHGTINFASGGYHGAPVSRYHRPAPWSFASHPRSGPCRSCAFSEFHIFILLPLAAPPHILGMVPGYKIRTGAKVPGTVELVPRPPGTRASRCFCVSPPPLTGSVPSRQLFTSGPRPVFFDWKRAGDVSGLTSADARNSCN